jgi:UDP-N-acetylmuramate: L-alanyl-gamma-D-glutamyl-meso-diaminopimelate ligase
MNIHLIAIGGAIMHQIALTEARKGHQVTGSDDVIQEPSCSRLLAAGILPERIGFFADNITPDIDLIILGMHAKFDNPELARAMELGLHVLSFPEFIYENSKQKTRVVIAGSHGKTSITSMVMHCLRANHIEFDYLVGSSVSGFDFSVRLSDAPIIILEGDEYLASPINKEPKFIYYHAHIATLSGIEWDHINVFKTEEIYNDQFKKLVHSLEPQAKLFYYDDPKVASIVSNLREDIELKSYAAIDYTIQQENFYAETVQGKIMLSVFGKHNMENIQAAKHICNELGMTDTDFWKSIASFEGAGRRLEKIIEEEKRTVYKDFAHSPSKLRATIQAVKEKYAERQVIACFELHTYSTLTADFLPQYRDSMQSADVAIVFIDKEVVEKKGNKPYTEHEILTHFNRPDILLITDIDTLNTALTSMASLDPVYLMMSSGTFAGIDFSEIGKKKAPRPAAIATPEKDSLNSETEKFEIYPTRNLGENQSLILTMLGLSYLFFILSPAYFYYQYRSKSNDVVYNLISACINFQTLASFILIIGIVAGQYYGFIFFLACIFNIIFVSQAIKQVISLQPINIPQGIMAVMPRIDKA